MTATLALLDPPPLQDLDALLLWVYVACMAAGAALFLYWSTDPRGVPRYEYLIATMIPVWSGLAYTAMAFGEGRTEVDGQVTYWARYADWAVSTPLLLTGLALTGMATVPKNLTLIGGLVAADVVMIGCGLVADLSDRPAMRWTFYAAGLFAFAIVLWLIWGPVKAVADRQDDRVSRLYRHMALFLTVLWFGYPLIWLVGPSGVRLIGQTAETALFVALPVVSKVVFSFFDLRGLRSLGLPFYDEHARLERIEVAAGAA